MSVLNLGLVVGILALCGGDLWLSLRRIKKYGLAIELNPMLIKLLPIFGPMGSLAIMVFSPYVTLGMPALMFGWTAGLSFLFGLRMGLGIIQLESLIHEDQLAELLQKAGINEGASDRHDA